MPPSKQTNKHAGGAGGWGRSSAAVCMVGVSLFYGRPNIDVHELQKTKQNNTHTKK